MQQIWKKVDYSGRPINPKFAVVHAAGEIIGGVPAYDFFVKNKIGAHALIYPDGKIVRMQDTSKSIGQAKNHNSVSFGAEFLIAGDHTWDTFVQAMQQPQHNKYTDAQYEAGGEWYAARCKEHGLGPDMILSHEWVDKLELEKGKARKEKIDPGPNFRWDKFYTAFYKHF